MRLRSVSLLALLACTIALSAAAATSSSAPALAGRWRLNPARSTELSPWRGFDLTLTIDAETVRIDRELGWGRRRFSDTMTLDLAKPETVVPVEMWPDNRHLGAYIGEKKTKRVRAQWLDSRRILRLSTDLVLETQQGPRDVNILSDFKVSASGTELTLTELRSTRNRPIVYVFKRIP